MTVVYADSSSCQTAVGVLDVRVCELHDVGHVEGAVLGAGLLTELLEVNVASRGHQQDEHLARGCDCLDDVVPGLQLGLTPRPGS